jgi:modification methylase
MFSPSHFGLLRPPWRAEIFAQAVGSKFAPMIWHKISNAAYEVEGGSGFLGKPYEPNGVIKNDIEFILMQRKGGGYHAPELATKILSLISAKNHKIWFQQIWGGLTGTSTKHQPATYPTELAARLIRRFSFVGDTILDSFLGMGKQGNMLLPQRQI